MQLKLMKLPPLLGPSGDGYHGKMPTRALFAEPNVGRATVLLEQETGGLVYTDFFRTADAQLAAHEGKRGTQKVGYSGHGYGYSFDLEVDATLFRHAWNYDFLIRYLEDRGWHCHRRDGQRGMEDWHFNYFGPDAAQRYLMLADPTQPVTWGRPVEAKIREQYDQDFFLSPTDVQTTLAKLGIYKGEIDSKMGPLTRAAITAFQRAWQLVPDGIPGVMTQRTLAYVAADVVF